MEQRKIPWKSEWKAAGLDPGPLNDEEAALVPLLQAENQAFLASHPRRTGPRRVHWAAWAAWSAPLAAAAILLAVALPLTPAPAAGGLERLKGGGEPVLTLYRQAAGKAQKLEPQSLVRPGDVIQASYQVSRPLFGALLSVDGTGQVTVHLASQGRSVALSPGGERFLDFSYELDRAPQFEDFFLLTSSQAFDLAPVVERLRRAPGGSLSAGAFGSGIQWTMLPLRKEAHP